MSDIMIHKIVIHELIKEQHQKIKKSKIRPSVLSPSHEVVKKLVYEITKLYGTRNNSAHYGTFRSEDGKGQFPNSFTDYSKLEEISDSQFLQLSKIAMDELYRKAEDTSAASGGYILFSDYSIAKDRFFIIAMIKPKAGITLSENLVPEELTELDLNRLHQAAKINFTRLSAYNNAEEVERNEINYLSFISPSAGQSASGYFITALGCAKGTAGSQATDTLIKESSLFFRENDTIKDHRDSFRNDLFTYLTQKQADKESAKISEIEALARKYFPATEPGQADALADAFVARLNSEENAVPVEFPVHNRTLKKHTHISYSGTNWDLKFERAALGTTDDADIYYDAGNNRVVIKDIPINMVKEIREELASRKVE